MTISKIAMVGFFIVIFVILGMMWKTDHTKSNVTKVNGLTKVEKLTLDGCTYLVLLGKHNSTIIPTVNQPSKCFDSLEGSQGWNPMPNDIPE